MCAKSRLSLDVVVGVVLAATPAALAAEALDTLLAALQKLGATVDPAQHCRALTDRGVPGLAARFGDLAQRVHLEALAEAPVPDPSALLAAFRAASHSADALFARVLPLLGERAAELLPEQPQLVHALSAEEIADLLTQLPADTALALLQCWRAGGHKATAGMVAHLSQAGQPVAELAAADGVPLPGPDAGRVRQAMGALRKCTDAATAEQVCQSLQPCPVIVSNMALQVCVSRDLATARRLFAATAEKDVITYNTLLKGEAQAGAWDAVRKLLAEMTERVTPNHVTFNTLLHACVAQKASPWAFVTTTSASMLAA